MHTVRILSRTFRKYRWHILVLSILGFLGAILEGIGVNAAIPTLTFLIGGGSAPTDTISHLIERVFALLHIPFKFRFLILFILGLFVLRAVSMAAFGYIRGRITADFSEEETAETLRMTFLASWPYLLTQKMGIIHNTLTRDVQRSAALLEVLGQAIQYFSGFLMYLLVALNISVSITIGTLVGGAVLLFIVRPLMRRNRATGLSYAEVERELSQFISEHVVGLRTVKAAGAERVSWRRARKLIESLRILAVKQSTVRSLSSSLFQPFGLLFIIVLFALTYRTPSFSLVSFGAALYLIQKIFIYLEQGQNALQQIIELVANAQHLEEFKSTLAAHREHGGGERRFSLVRELRFADVSLSFGDTEVLKGVSFSVGHGQTVGLVGPSGAGKSTVADLVLRLLSATGGAVTLDGINVTDIDLEDWRRHVAYMPQDVFLLNDTIEANIRFYDATLSAEDIERGAREANILPFIETLPLGMQTVVGDRGMMLSGGQRQRIALARALARRPAILVLDEATSSLDTESEALVQSALDELHGKMTVLVIAHRLSTIEKADRVIVLKEGKVAEEGSPAHLRSNRDSYLTTHASA